MTQHMSRSETRIPVQNSPDTDRRRPGRAGSEEHEGATENEVTPTSPPSGPEYEDEPKQG
jgi:hypothetical protein